MRTKLISCALVLALLLSLCTTACAAEQLSPGSDIVTGSWYAEAVGYVRANGFMDDISATAFEPNTPATRATLVTALYRLAGRPAVTAHGSFSDVQGDSPHADAVAWASSTGLISGYTDGRFGPDDTVTREQFAAILWRQAGTPAPVGGAEGFSDHAAISPYAFNAVAWASDAGLFSGKDGGRFDPGGETTRAETAMLLYRLSQGVTPPAENKSRILVAYFSRTGTTEEVAQTMATLTGGDLFELIPETAYPTDYNACLEQARQELSANARPVLSSHVADMSQYDVVLLGFPIWHGDAPMIVRTFLEEYDLSGKTVAPFSTSGSSGISSAMAALRTLCPGAAVVDGLSIPSSALSRAETLSAEWLDGLDLNEEANTMPQLTLQVGAQRYTIALEDNETTRALLERLPLTVTMGELNGNEKFYYLDDALPANAAEPGRIQAGDLMLYGNNCLVLFYESFTSPYSYTRLGRVDDPAGLSDALGSGQAEVSLQEAIGTA